MTFTERLVWAASLLATPRGIGRAHELVVLPNFFGLYSTASLLILPIFICEKIRVLGQIFVGCFWMAVAHDSMRVHRIPLLYPERGVCDCEHHFCSYRSVRTEGLAPSIWISTGCLHSAKTLGVCLFNVFRSTRHSQSRTVASGTSCIAGPSQAMQIFLQVPSISQKAHLRPTSSFLISGLAHAAGDYILTQNFSEGKAVQFFLLQAVAITFEDAVIAIASRLGYK